LNEVPWLTALPVEVQNTFFGSGITVSGLLTGADILKALKDVPEGLGNVLLPPNCVSHHGLFLDDMTPEELSKTLGCNVFVGTYNLIESILMVANGDPVSHAPVAARTDDHPYISSHQMVEED